MPAVDHYAEALLADAGRCFRLVTCKEGAGPTHCPEPTGWRGPWRAPNGRRYQVEACEGHRPTLDGEPLAQR